MSDNIMAARGNVRDGDSFTTFLELEEKVKSYEESNSVQLWKREARTVTSARKRVDRYLKSDLKYYQLKYCCIHGAKAFKTDGKGIRQNTMWVIFEKYYLHSQNRTFKQDRQMHISLRIDERGSHLVVTSVFSEHNHPVSQVSIVWMYYYVSTEKILNFIFRQDC